MPPSHENTNGFGEYKRLILDFMDRQDKQNEAILAQLTSLQNDVTVLRTQRDAAKWAVGLMGGCAGALLTAAARKVGLL